ncbi:MAG: hypothetical protein AAGA32_20595 [Pseudomonadota bacterium]
MSPHDHPVLAHRAADGSFDILHCPDPAWKGMAAKRMFDPIPEVRRNDHVCALDQVGRDRPARTPRGPTSTILQGRLAGDGGSDADCDVRGHGLTVDRRKSAVC